MGHRIGGHPQQRSGGGAPGVDVTDGLMARLARLTEVRSSAVLTALFIALTVIAATGAADPLDTVVARHFRPNNDWGDLQERYGPWITHLAPIRMFALLAATCVALAAWRRSWQPLVVGIVPALVSVAATLLVKSALARPDPLGGISPDGGSYPSGHMVAVVVSVSACLLVVSTRARWWWWAVLVVPSGLMAASLVVTASHWVSDVVGGALLAGAVVTGTSRLRLRRSPPAGD